MKKAIYVMDKEPFDLVYPDFVRQQIEQDVNIIGPPMSRQELHNNPTILKDVEIVLSGWGGPAIDTALLDHAPHLKAVLYAAGSIKQIATDEAWERGIVFSTAVHANAIPVAEFTLSQIIFSLKNGWQFVRQIKRERQFPNKPFMIPGAFKSKIGIISLSTVGRCVVELLQPFDVEILAFDPFVTKEEADRLGVKLCSLEEIFEFSDIVSLHAPLLPKTIGMITGDHIHSMKEGASFINTARGAIVKESEMVDILRKRKDITAILDVTDPEPPLSDSELFQLENVVITPHLAGSEGAECGRMGQYMLEELRRYIKGDTLRWAVSKEQFERMA
ncbi:Phosphoglycerate dehydrogenase [Gracilibacillus ureilyticus]|uniref:Phosphoglycerate dehydrogenase n=1 Tax=Gracilibacillus ureilyticus TaxID=531814 RepID=A0A1H9VWV6_9BACI|nr:hydroxyacid dehydrogenase [Gracilibacillus ureilyticus]SES26246.1 Phosphoglycerate dehydrogenase [Gracilibacillus ureilyticus]